MVQIMENLEEYTKKDHMYSSGRIFNSICTEPLIESKQAFCRYIDTNLADNRLFPGQVAIESDVISLLGRIVGVPEVRGALVTGGTEANLIALSAARATKQSKQAGHTRPFNVVSSESVHFSILKACKLMGLELRTTKLDNNYRTDPSAISKSIDENTIAVLATAGTSDLGMIDPIAKLSDVAEEHDLFFHIDAASGGLLIPYWYPESDYGFRNAHSITIDPHKYGYSVIPSGCILFNTEKSIATDKVDSFFYGTHEHLAISGTRSGASAASVYAAFRTLGPKGFLSKVSRIKELTRFTENYSNQIGLKLFTKTDLNVVSIDVKDPVLVLSTLEKEGFIISIVKRYNVLRLVIHIHHSESVITELLGRIKEIDTNQGD
jgi:tyrosine decarboxylase MnfA